MDIISLHEKPYEDYHHRSYFIPNHPSIQKSSVFDIGECSQSHFYAQDFEGNLVNITPTMSIDISDKPGSSYPRALPSPIISSLPIS